MTGYLDSTDTKPSCVINYDYTRFLCESNKYNRTFIKTLLHLVPWSFSSDDEKKERCFPSEEFAKIASQSLSSLNSDVSNLIMLIELARVRHIHQLNIMLPYSLDEKELAKIIKHTEAQLQQFSEDREYLQVTLM
ncbi:hypothetical protein [Enterovibrio coralii]|uniref:Uncharacterized protein n=1 Tax=Enterovibrio coralii TaxID=294935 RepID=A0A135I946_9GAMM|nr:hypothetical protein [Enterovibrio coralii]KXF81982.1 hypothetical protein ATN88_18715 [Enterovibrio coralii]